MKPPSLSGAPELNEAVELQRGTGPGVPGLSHRRSSVTEAISSSALVRRGR